MATSTARFRAFALGGEDEEFPKHLFGKATAKTFQTTRQPLATPNVSTVNQLANK